LSEPLVLPEYGPTLPALARRRFGWRERTTVALLVAVGVLIVVGILLVSGLWGDFVSYLQHGIDNYSTAV
jgi:hypothetical protein